MITDRQSGIINVLKGILPFLVVAIHTSFDASLCYKDGIEPFLRVLITKVGGVAVPTFFYISGLLFFNKFEEWNWVSWKRKVQNRARTLLLPFILWIVIDFVMKYVWAILKHELPDFSFATFCEFLSDNGYLRIFYDRPLVEYSDSILGYAVDASKPIDGPLWYVRELIVLVLLAPAIWKALKATRYYAIAIFGILYLFNIGLPFVLVSPTGLFFFSLGAAFSIAEQDFLNVFKKFRLVSYILYGVLLLLCFVISDMILNALVFRCFVMVGVVMIFNLATSCYDVAKIKPVNILTNSSFFVYAGHAVLITEISNYLLWHALPFVTEWILVLKVFLRPVVSVGICLFIFVTMRRFCPKLLGALTGGRF